MKLIKEILNGIFIVPLLMVLATVFVIDHELANGVVSGKYFWFYISIGLVSLSVLLSFLLNRKHIHFSLVDLLIAIFCIIGIIVTYYHNRAITGKLILFILICILYFYFKIFIVQYKWNSYLLLTFLITTGFIEAIWGLKQLYGFSVSQHTLFSTTGSFFNSGPYAGYLAMVAPMAFYYLLNDYRIFNKRVHIYFIPFYIRWWLSLVTFIAILSVLPGTMSRASWVATVAGCIVVGACFLFKQKGRTKMIKKQFNLHKKKFYLAVFSGIFITIIALAGIYHLKKDSADGRALIWKVSVKTILKHPLGVGLGNFPGAYGDVQATYFASGKGTEQEQYVAGSPQYGFNEYLQLSIELGVVTFFIFICIIVLIIWEGGKGKQYADLGGLISILVFASMSYPFSILPFVIVLVFLLALCSSQYATLCFKRKDIIKITIPLLALMSIVTLFLYNRYPTYRAYEYWKKTKMLYDMGLYEEAQKEYNKLEPYLNDQLNFIIEYCRCLSKTGDYEKSNQMILKANRIACDPMLYNIMGKNYQALKNYDEAEKKYITASNIIPSRLYPYYLLAKLYYETGNTEKVFEMTKIIETKEIKVYSPAIEDMRKEIKQLYTLD